MKKFALAISALALACTALAGPALAETNATSVRVSRANLDLSQTQDASRMLSKLRLAALHVCQQRTDSMLTPRDANDLRTCRREVMAAAVERVGAPEVTRLYNGAHAQQTASR